MPSSGLTEMPSVRKQAPSNTRSSLAPAGSTLGSPVGSGNPNSDIFSSTVCPEAMKRLLSKLRCVTSYLSKGNSDANAVTLSETDKLSEMKPDLRGRVSKRCCVFEVLMPSQHHSSGKAAAGKGLRSHESFDDVHPGID